MATEQEIMAELERRTEALSGIIVADNVKQEIAGLGLVMECCFTEASQIIKHKYPASYKSIPLADNQERIAFQLFGAVVKRSLPAQQQEQFDIPPEVLRMLKSKAP